MYRPLRPRRPQRGNILFLILLAVALFAALNYAVTNSMQGGGKDSSSENYDTGAAAILNFIKQIDTALMRMQITNGIPKENLSFRYTNKSYAGTPYTAYNNANCTNDACRIFEVSGGGVAPITFERWATKIPSGWGATYTSPGYYDFIMMQWPYAGTSANDIVMQIVALDPRVCSRLQRSLNLGAIPNFSGPFLSASVPATWDNAAQICTSNCSTFIGQTTVVRGVTTGTGDDGSYCSVSHLLIAR